MHQIGTLDIIEPVCFGMCQLEFDNTFKVLSCMTQLKSTAGYSYKTQWNYMSWHGICAESDCEQINMNWAAKLFSKCEIGVYTCKSLYLTFERNIKVQKTEQMKQEWSWSRSKTSRWYFRVLCLPSTPQGQAKGVNIQRSPDSSQSTCSLSVKMDHTNTEWSIFLVR